MQLFSTIDQKLRQVFDDPVLRRQYTWWMLETILQKKESELLLAQSIELMPVQQQEIDRWLHAMIVEHKPIQYLIGFVPFNDVEILIEPPILIPRPETEEWTCNLIEQLKRLKNKKIQILDLCSGTGCIAVALARALPEARVVAADISEHAVALGKKNAVHNNVTNIEFLQSDLFDAVRNKKFDLIVSNPPYIAQSEWQTLDDSVKNWEDKRALIADDHGLAIIKKIIEQAASHIHNNDEFEQKNIPNLIIEIGYDQADDVAAIMKDAMVTYVSVHKDLEGKNRVVSGRVREVSMVKQPTDYDGDSQ